MKHIFYILITIILINCSPKITHKAQVTDGGKLILLRNKYANILEVPIDSIYNIPLYQNIEKWSIIKDSLDFKDIPYSILFIDYLCYKQYGITLPESYEKIYKDQQVYLYRNPKYLNEGDLVFFQDKNRPEKSIGFYIQNQYFTNTTPSGEIKYYHIRDTLSQIKILVNAKLKKR